MNPVAPATIELEEDDDRLTIRIRGEIDLSNADALGDDIARRITARAPAAVTVDLTDVAYLDSRGVLLLMRLAARLRDGGTALRVIAPPDGVAGRVLAIAGVAESFAAGPLRPPG